MGKTLVFNKGESQPAEDEISMECGLFFDGTLNSKYNTLLRTMVKEGMPRKADKEEVEAYYKGSSRTFFDQQGVDNSYSNDYSNVARLWEYCVPDYRIYIEGIGTVISVENENLEKQMSNGEQDDEDGFQFGAGKVGIRAKVRKACKILALKIKEEKDRKPKEVKKINLTLDVFGFSRGAAAARSFVHEVNVMKSYLVEGYLHNEARDSFKKQQNEIQRLTKENKVAIRDGIPSDPVGLDVKKLCVDHDAEVVDDGILKKTNGRLPRMGHLGFCLMNEGLTFEEIERIEVIVRFVGVYDTVSSYFKGGSITKFLPGQILGSADGNINFANDVQELHLNDLGKVSQVVHFTAMDEHRYNFALTRLPGSIEKQFPGVHCDIGGAYLSEKEIVDEIEIAVDPTINPVGIFIKKNKVQKFIYRLKGGYYGLDAKKKLTEYANHLVYSHWFKKEQLTISDVNSFKHNDEVYKIKGLYDKLTGIRYLRKEYSYIPLLFMCEYFKKQLGSSIKACFDQESDFKDMFSVDKIDVLKKAQDYLRPYVMDNKGRPWEYLTFESIRLKNEILEKKRIRLTKIWMRRAEEKEAEYKKNSPTKQDGQLEQISQRTRQEIEKNRDVDKADDKQIEQIRQQMKRNAEIMEDQYQEKLNEIEARHTKMMYAQGVLEILRNEYFHWSSNRDWFGMQPTGSKERKKY